ncbi:cache domain-containing protein [Lentimicrobium sp. L6]|uniref:cache domain-containing protein n=1 Tax=Lentimicrobium sp. L6 TaxID=2735916 RepID=UPI00155520A1|nr:cache domain-containing protein [Lentimicrobium sp. L6]NPD86485.1 cache domain-containing protein [Lentimicrobium sp. L6]
MKDSDQKNHSTKGSKKIDKRILFNTLLVFGPIFLLVLLGSIFILKTQESLEIKLIKDVETSIVDNKLKNIEEEIGHVIHDLLILKSNRSIEKYWEFQNEEFVNDLSDEILSIVEYQQVYDQCRIIDIHGVEVIRVNYNKGEPVLAPKNQLQNKADRYYFKDAIKLNKGEVFVSSMDLNIENGEIELPLKPMIRIATPIFDNDDEKKGIIIFNFFGDRILHQLGDSTNSMVYSEVMLLNSKGYYLQGPSPEKEWGFMFDGKKDITFQYDLKNEWEEICDNEAS